MCTAYDSNVRMPLYIVTFKFFKKTEHDPNNKQTGECQTSQYCTDSTGTHHNKLLYIKDEKHLEQIHAELNKKHHVTRIERVDTIHQTNIFDHHVFINANEIDIPYMLDPEGRDKQWSD